MSCLREVQTISQSPHILPMPSLTRLTSGGVLNPLKNTTNTSHNELLHQDPLQPPLEPRPLLGKAGVYAWQKMGGVTMKAAPPGIACMVSDGSLSGAPVEAAEVVQRLSMV